LSPQNELNLIRSILKKLNTSLTSEEVLSFALQRVKDSFECLACAIILLDPARGRHKVLISKGWSNAFIKEFHRRPFEGFLTEAAYLKQPLLVISGEKKDEAKTHTFEHPYGSFLAVPMGIRGKNIGILYLSCSGTDTFSEKTQNVMVDLAALFALIMDDGQMSDRLVTLSGVDPLTNLCSFKYWHEQLDREINHAEKVDYDISLMEVRLNRFREYNSMYGHVKSDQLLMEISEIILDRLCNLDVPCRIGPKWHILLVGEDEDAAKKIAKLILADMDALPKRGDPPVSLSIGISTYIHGEGEKAIIQRTENALREARRLGGNSFRAE